VKTIIFRPKRDKVPGGREVHNGAPEYVLAKYYNDLINNDKMGGECRTHTEMRNAYRVKH
jgi:hypothetical protein